MKMIGVEQTVDLTKEKKMGVKGMAEVKNAYDEVLEEAIISGANCR